MSSIRGAMERVLTHIWYGSSPLSLLLVPLSWPVRWVVARRRANAPAKRSNAAGARVVVVGGLTAGGTGKTPVLIALGQWLIERGCRVGVVSRGYGGELSPEPRWVEVHDSARVVGDEPLLIKQRLGVPVVVCPDRQRAVTDLIEGVDIDVVLSDDGLQHYAMLRDMEIAVLDAERGMGNGSNDVDRRFAYQPVRARHIATGRMLPWQECVDEWVGQVVAAATGLGQPGQFFTMLRGSGLRIHECAMPDHGALSQRELDALEQDVVLVTAKDAVKLAHLVDPRIWVVEIDVALPPSLLDLLTRLLPIKAPTD